MPYNLSKALALTTLVAALLVALSLVVPRFAAWPEPENPPRQGEALDYVGYLKGKYFHSSTALSKSVREPFNTWTNLAFVLGGGVLVFSGGLAIRRQTGLALICVGVGSLLYHASSSRTLRHLDVGAMYWIYLMLILLSLGVVSRRFEGFFTRTSTAWAFIIPVIAALIAVCRNVRVGEWKPFDLSLITGLTAGIAGFGLLSSARRVGGWLFSFGTLLVFGVAVACQIGDRPGGWLCNPDATIQAHGMWHILGATACFMACHQLSKAWRNTEQVSTDGSRA